MNYIERYWRDATPQDAIKEPPMLARFRDEHYKDWVIDKLIFWDRSEVPWNRDDGYCYERCQVYDAPDPGEGWRLIDVDTETPMVGDEIYYKEEKGWLIRHHDKPYDKGLTYRRRIEQPKPEQRYEPFRWEDREQLRGRWVQCAGVPCGEWMITTMYLGSHGELRVNSVDADRLRTGYVFADTGEPVGRRVQ